MSESKKDKKRNKVNLEVGKEYSVDEILEGLEGTPIAKKKYEGILEGIKDLSPEQVGKLKEIFKGKIDMPELKNIEEECSKSKNREEGMADLIASLKNCRSVACVGVFFDGLDIKGDGFSMAGVSSIEDAMNIIRQLLDLAVRTGKGSCIDTVALFNDTYNKGV